MPAIQRAAILLGEARAEDRNSKQIRMFDLAANPKFEIRNPKQIQMFKRSKFKTVES